LVETYQNVINIPNDNKLYQKGHKLYYVNGREIFQMVIKYNNIVHSKALQILPKLGFLVWKQTIWQPWSVSAVIYNRLNLLYSNLSL
jgi:hypothetical protein